MRRPLADERRQPVIAPGKDTPQCPPEARRQGIEDVLAHWNPGYVPACGIPFHLILGLRDGLVREWRQRGAGLRINALVALGAALFEGLAVVIEGEHGADPTRIAAYIVSGIGFLGGGVILRHGMTVTGINTAATI